ncbi:4551_t:CDS:2 [Cetraspora pellucida]|uniref:Fucosyltransferase n=1 Tax=Cetraspora pellucida TaxID=1433469 RepID=A0A9N9DGP9_9GLOM|nr:4551_t:CDS:2 [Cetraspora pellucida]
MANNCQSKNNHNDYVKELMQYITVHSFRQCLNNQEVSDNIRDKYSIKKSDTAYWKEHMYELKLDIFIHYKFVLAFENLNCEDDYVPSYSIIKVTDFKNIANLVKYINEVANN